MANQVPTFAATDTNCDAPIVTLLIRDNAKLFAKQKKNLALKEQYLE